LRSVINASFSESVTTALCFVFFVVLFFLVCHILDSGVKR
jgi:hypothetical protein